MQIQLGTLYVNKTFKYLVPCLKLYGETFVTKLNSVFNLAFGIHDSVLDGTEFEGQKLIYILSDKLHQAAKFQNFLNYTKHQPYYVMDYAYDDIEKGRKHMIVVKFPEDLFEAYDKFIEGKYSKMYTKDEISMFFRKEGESKDVITRNIKMIPVFIERIKESFGDTTEITKKEILNEAMEFDFPPERQKEFFNYKKP
jgi:hypothetical protein